MDDVDRASTYQEEVIKRGVKAAKSSSDRDTVRAALTAQCRNCREKLPQGEPFCDGDCRDDFIKLRRAKAFSGQ